MSERIVKNKRRKKKWYVNTQKKKKNIYIYIDRIDDAVFAADFCIGGDAVLVFFLIINLKSWEGGVEPVLDRPKQG
jgi:predicted nucleic acid-binding Zn finger protein